MPVDQNDPTNFALGDFQVDLLALSDALGGKNGDHAKLAGLIQKALTMRSILHDLSHAERCLGVAVKLAVEGAGGDQTGKDIVGALTTEALIFYCRATQTGVADTDAVRSASNLYASLPKEMEAMHEEMMTLRSASVAHFGMGVNHHTGAWSTDALVRYQFSGKNAIVCPTRRVGSNSDVLKELVMLTSTARSIASLKADKFDAQLDEEFIALYHSHRSFREACIAHQFDPEQFFGSEAGAAEWYTNATEGKVRYGTA